MKGVFKCAREDDKKIQECQALKLGDAPVHPQEIFKETQASKLGDAPVHPLLYQQSSVCPSPCYIFITSYVMCYAWSVPLFTFQFVLVLLAVHNKSEPILPCLGEKHAPFHSRTQHRFSCLSLSLLSQCHAQLLVFMLYLSKSYYLGCFWNSLQLSCLSCLESWLVALSGVSCMSR